MVETLYAVGMSLTDNGATVEMHRRTHRDISDRPMVPPRTPIDPRTKKFTLRRRYFGSEKQLEDMIEQQPDVLGYGYRLIGRQVEAANGRLDLLLESQDGAMIVVELKKDKADDVAVGQILRYLSWVESSYPSNTTPRGIIVAKEFSDNLRLAVRGSSYHIQLVPTSMVEENNKSI